MSHVERNPRKRFANLELGARVFISAIIIAGFAVIAHSVLLSRLIPISSQWFVLAALTLLSGSITIILPGIDASISVSETFVFTSVLLFGTEAGTIIVTLDGLIISLAVAQANWAAQAALQHDGAGALDLVGRAALFCGHWRRTTYTTGNKSPGAATRCALVRDGWTSC